MNEFNLNNQSVVVIFIRNTEGEQLTIPHFSNLLMLSLSVLTLLRSLAWSDFFLLWYLKTIRIKIHLHYKKFFQINEGEFNQPRTEL